jgi:hypothetical protein
VSTARRIRAFAAFDLAITAVLALPPTATMFLDMILRLDRMAGFDTPEPVWNPLWLFFVHLAGVLGVLWALARLSRPQADLARLDSAGRVAVAALLVWAIVGGATPVLGLFVVTEVAGLLQLVGGRR